MTPEAPSPFPRPAPNADALLALPTAAQERRLLNIALEISHGHETRDQAAALADPRSPLVVEAYLRSNQYRSRNMHSLDTLATLSLQDGPFAEASWRAAVNSAQTMEQIGYGAYRPFALEDLAQGQTDRARLMELTAIAKTRRHYEQQEILRAVGVQQARSGDLLAARETRIAAKSSFDPDAADEIGLALIDGAIAEGDRTAAWMTFGSISPRMKAWGLLKMNNHGLEPDRQVIGEPRLEEHWETYNARQQGEIIGDVLAAGDASRALALARRTLPASYETYLMRKFQHNTIVRIAHWQASHGDTAGGLETLERLKEEAETGLGNSIVERMNLPEVGNTPDEQHAVRKHTMRHDEYVSALADATAQILALRARHGAAFVMQEMNRAMFYGDGAERLHEAMSRRTVAAALARFGHIAEAVAVAAAIPENDGDNLFQEEKAHTYLDIARAIRARRLASGATPATIEG